jgi:hypothetical protein
MSQEIETAGLGSLGSLFRLAGKAHAVPVGTPCANCATPLQGPWCHQCGQVGEDFHRSTWRLIIEAVEGLWHVDGRLWRTLPNLLLHPGRLTRSYLDGHRAPQIPPLRLFLVVLLLVFFVGVGGPVVIALDDDDGKPIAGADGIVHRMTPAEQEEAKESLDRILFGASERASAGTKSWLRERVEQAAADPERFKLLLEQWAERFAFLTLPLAAGLLSLLFAFQRRFYVFDHLIFSLHSLSSTGLMLAVSSGLSSVTGGLSTLILLGPPVHLYVHMRAVYGTDISGTLLRMALLFVGSAVGLVLIMLGLLWVGLSGMTPA